MLDAAKTSLQFTVETQSHSTTFTLTVSSIRKNRTSLETKLHVSSNKDLNQCQYINKTTSSWKSVTCQIHILEIRRFQSDHNIFPEITLQPELTNLKVMHTFPNGVDQTRLFCSDSKHTCFNVAVRHIDTAEYSRQKC